MAIKLEDLIAEYRKLGAEIVEKDDARVILPIDSDERYRLECRIVDCQRRRSAIWDLVWLEMGGTEVDGAVRKTIQLLKGEEGGI